MSDKKEYDPYGSAVPELPNDLEAGKPDGAAYDAVFGEMGDDSPNFKGVSVPRGLPHPTTRLTLPARNGRRIRPHDQGQYRPRDP